MTGKKDVTRNIRAPIKTIRFSKCFDAGWTISMKAKSNDLKRRNLKLLSPGALLVSLSYSVDRESADK